MIPHSIENPMIFKFSIQKGSYNTYGICWTMLVKEFAKRVNGIFSNKVSNISIKNISCFLTSFV